MQTVEPRLLSGGLLCGKYLHALLYEKTCAHSDYYITPAYRYDKHYTFPK